MSKETRLLDWLNETSIMEMALARKLVVSKVRNHAMPLIEHLIKILVFKTKSSWDDTILNMIKDIDQQYISKSRKLTAQDYYRFLYTEPVDDTKLIEKMIKNLLVNQKYISMPSDLREYKGIIPEKEIVDITVEIKSFLRTLSDMLSKDEALISDYELLVNRFISMSIVN